MFYENEIEKEIITRFIRDNINKVDMLRYVGVINMAMISDDYEEKIVSLLLTRISYLKKCDIESDCKDLFDIGIKYVYIEKAIDLVSFLKDLTVFRKEENDCSKISEGMLKIAIFLLSNNYSFDNHSNYSNSIYWTMNRSSILKQLQGVLDSRNTGFLYKFIGVGSKPLYIGKTKTLKRRLKQHTHLPKECYDMIRRVECVEVPNSKLNLYEEILIHTYKPIYNTSGMNRSELYDRNDIVKYLESLNWRTINFEK